jgi:acetyl esterase/lipase
VLASTVALVGCTEPERPDAGPSAAAPSTAVPSTAVPSTAVPDGADCTTTSVESTRDQVYLAGTGASPELTSLDVYSPVRDAGCPPTPLLVWVHGGGWQIGDRRQQLDDKVAWLTSLGWTVVSTNYRLSPEVTYPRHHDDVAAAVDWVLDRADELDIDPDRVVLAGHSAGAATVAGVATNPRHLATVGRDRSELACVVALDTEGYDVEAAAGRGSQVYLQAFGDDPAVWADASPMRHVEAGAGIADMLVVTRGTPARRATAQRFVDELVDADVPAHLVEAGGLDHAAVNRVVGTDGDEVVTPAIAEFLEEC